MYVTKKMVTLKFPQTVKACCGHFFDNYMILKFKTVTESGTELSQGRAKLQAKKTPIFPRRLISNDSLMVVVGGLEPPTPAL